MTIEDVQKRIVEIISKSGDDEAQHICEDVLHVEVLQAIASGCTNTIELAKEALKTIDLDFNRWYA